MAIGCEPSEFQDSATPMTVWQLVSLVCVGIQTDENRARRTVML